MGKKRNTPNKKVFIGLIVLSVLTALFISVGGIFAAGVLAAAENSEFSKQDGNSDGAISRDELKADAERRFKTMDSDSNGKVSAEEFQAYCDRRFGEMDKDQNGLVKIDEYVGFFCGEVPSAEKVKHVRAKKSKHNLFDRHDTNKDAQIGVDECVAYRIARFKDMDATKDGNLSKEEKKSSDTNTFQTIDTNDDGIVTLEEFVFFTIGKDKSVSKGRKGKSQTTE